MSLKSKEIFPFGPPNVLGGACLYDFYFRLESTQVPIMEPFSFQVVGVRCPGLVRRACLFHIILGNPWTIWWHQHLDTSLLVAKCGWQPHPMLGLLCPGSQV
jgi:hypothetical protein